LDAGPLRRAGAGTGTSAAVVAARAPALGADR
jgi:hypothetical protein